jgi:hypothetical protein
VPQAVRQAARLAISTRRFGRADFNIGGFLMINAGAS